MMVIDGSFGEGGGQILRSSLTLALLTGRALRVSKIRAGRKKPGLLRQHLACVAAASAVGRAEVEGDELGSQELHFRPGPIEGGEFEFSIGSAGSTSLVLQTILPALFGTESRVRVRGGTHNPLAPTFDFLDQVYFPLLCRMGLRVEATLLRPGFFPAGGGEVLVELGGRLEHPVELGRLGGDEPLRAWTLSHAIPTHVDERELGRAGELLSIPPEHRSIRRRDADGPGNVLQIGIGEHEVVSVFGERGRKAEDVAHEGVVQARRYLELGAQVGEFLADQLLLPVALGGGAFLTGPLSLHARTNLEIVRRFLGPESLVAREEEGLMRIEGRGLLR